MCDMSDVCRVWPQIEDMGYDWISGQDHFYTQRADGAGSFEAVACHAALAALTERVRVGCLVYSAGYRNPAVLAKSLVTIDHLSNGRLEVGIGAGWYEEEYKAYGIPFEPFNVRLRRMTETIEILRALWSNERTDFDGEFSTLRNARCDPKPLQRAPRIWVGAKGPKALKAAAQYGDGWNANFMSPEDFCECCSLVMPMRCEMLSHSMRASRVNDEHGAVHPWASCMTPKFTRSHGALRWRKCTLLSVCGTAKRIEAFHFVWLKKWANDFQIAQRRSSRTRDTTPSRFATCAKFSAT